MPILENLELDQWPSLNTLFIWVVSIKLKIINTIKGPL